LRLTPPRHKAHYSHKEHFFHEFLFDLEVIR
jgi:hypothetical protein